MKKNNLIQNAHTVILSAHRVILSAAKNLFLTVFAIGLFASCQKELATEVTGGKLKNEAQLDAAPALTLRSPKSADGVVNVLMTEGAGIASELIYATSSRPAEHPQTIVLSADTTLAAAYRIKSKIDYKVLPEAFYKFDESQIITLDQNATTSASTLLKIYATNTVGNQLEAGQYLLPVVAKATSQNISTTLYYNVVVRSPFKSDAELYEGDDAFFIFYINTEYYDPRLVMDYYMSKSSFIGNKVVWYNAIGNIVNLRKATICLDNSSDKALLNLGTDMRYVLDHASKYITPLQNSGRKVCISIEGANKGIGFCNLTDEQIRDFSLQVKQIIDYYSLDGVNLWDRMSGYDLPDAKPTNTTSYPKLIKALRETLGSDKLLTLTDYESPTEYFWDVEATGGIEVGAYLDYAWSGYNKYIEGFQIVDPYHPSHPSVSKIHPRKPIKGLLPSKYACVNIPWGTDILPEDLQYTEDLFFQWVADNQNSNKICVYEDLRTNLQDKYEGAWGPHTAVYIYNSTQNEYLYSFDITRLWHVESGKLGYGKWIKDW